MSHPAAHEKSDAVEVEHGNNSRADTAEMNPKFETIDTVHNDEAVRVLAGYTGDHSWTPQEEKKLKRKLDRRVLSILCVTFALQYYDKAMIGQAVSIRRRPCPWRSKH